MRVLSSIALVLIFLGSGLTTRAELVNGVKAVVHDSVVTYQEVFDKVTPLLPELNARHWNDPQLLSRERLRLLDENTETLVEHELILHEFQSSGLMVPEGVIDDYLDDYIQGTYGGSRALMVRDLQAKGLTLEKFRQQIRERFIVSQMRLRNVSDALMISPHKIEVYYLGHTNDFKVEDQVKLRMITLNKPAEDNGQTRRLAGEILSQIKAGATFEEMAGVYSQDSKRTQGGSWDWERTAVLRQEFRDAAAALAPGQMSDVIDAPEACYLMQLEDRKAAHTRPLNEVRQEIEDILLRAERQRLQNQWIERLKKKTFVRYF